MIKTADHITRRLKEGGGRQGVKLKEGGGRHGGEGVKKNHMEAICTNKGGDWRTWHNHHLARPPDHIKSSKLDISCILIGSIHIFWKI